MSSSWRASHASTGLGSPEEYEGQILRVHKGVATDMEWSKQRLVDIQYLRNQANLAAGSSACKVTMLEVHPSYEETAVRIEWWGDTIERITRFDTLTGEMLGDLTEITVFPARTTASDQRMKRAVVTIEEELRERLALFESQSKLLEAERLRMRTTYDLEMLREVGFCSGIENYSRHIDGRAPGEAPYTLLDYFPDDWLCVIDESHVTVPQIHGMYEDKTRKETLVEFGFRLPSALDNRPLRFDEFVKKVNQTVYMSATPAPYELRTSAASPSRSSAPRVWWIPRSRFDPPEGRSTI